MSLFHRKKKPAQPAPAPVAAKPAPPQPVILKTTLPGPSTGPARPMDEQVAKRLAQALSAYMKEQR